MPTIVCKDCGKTVDRRGCRSLYCLDCAIQRDKARKLKWQLKSGYVPPPLSEEQKRRMAERQAERVRRGILLNREAAWTISWPVDREIDLHHVMRLVIPFDPVFSKNAIWSMKRGSNYIFVGQKHRQAREYLVQQIRHCIATSGGQSFHNGKVWIDLLVQKPSHRGDAINFLDGICDAIKVAIGIDDNWFAVRRVDWQIVKETPRIIVGIGQEITEPHQVCSYCGDIKPLTEFPQRKALKLGVDRVCISCSRIDGAIKRAKKREAAHAVF
jgi:hypothetical protein